MAGWSHQQVAEVEVYVLCLCVMGYCSTRSAVNVCEYLTAMLCTVSSYVWLGKHATDPPSFLHKT